MMTGIETIVTAWRALTGSMRDTTEALKAFSETFDTNPPEGVTGEDTDRS